MINKLHKQGMQIQTSQQQLPKNSQTIALQKRKKSKSFKLMTTRYTNRSPSREFNNPIYAGFDLNLHEQNRQYVNWGPWVASSQDAASKGMAYPGISRPGGNGHGVFIEARSPSRSQLPDIRQRNKYPTAPTQKQLKIVSTQLIEKKLRPNIDHNLSQNPNPSMSRINLNFKLKINPSSSPNTKSSSILNNKIQIVKQLNQYQTRTVPLQKQNNRKSLKLGTVVYNYCTTSSNLDQCLLNYQRKSEPYLQRNVIKIQMFNNKLGQNSQNAHKASTQLLKQKQNQWQQTDQIAAKDKANQKVRFKNLKAYWLRRNNSIPSKLILKQN